MNPIRRGIVFLLALPTATATCTPYPAGGTEYFVDWSKGVDTNAGTRSSPWKHAPGDIAAEARPRGVSLQPGDVVRFAGGVAYRGTIRVTASGVAKNSIIFTGSGFGQGRGIIDGGDMAAVQACHAAAECEGAINWQQLSVVKFPVSSLTPTLFDNSGPLFETQIPAPKDAFYADDVESWRITSQKDARRIEDGRLLAPDFIKTGSGRTSGSLLFWVRGNEVVRREIKGIEGQDLIFDGSGLDLYDDRDGRVAIVGTLMSPIAARTYAVVSPGIAIANLSAGSAVSVGSNRGGFLLQKASQIVIRDLDFVNQSSDAKQQGEGVAIEVRGSGSDTIQIIGNKFGPAVLHNHQGAIRITDAANVVVEHNRFQYLVDGSGVRTGARNSNLIVRQNTFDRIGRTAIALFGVTGGAVEGNTITDARGAPWKWDFHLSRQSRGHSDE